MKTESIEIQLTTILDEYNEQAQKVANAAIQKVARDAVNRLKNTSPKKTGSYARGWSIRRADSAHGNIIGLAVYNRTDGSLTHLLENGHVIRNKRGEYGRARAMPHIQPVEEWAKNELPAEIERQL